MITTSAAIRRLLACLAVSVAITPARADDFSPAQVPASAKWLMHFDADAARDSTVGGIARKRLESNLQFQDRLTQLEARSGTRAMSDLHGVLIYGREFDGPHTVLVVHAEYDKNLVQQHLAAARPDRKTKPYNDHELISWQTKLPGPIAEAALRNANGNGNTPVAVEVFACLYDQKTIIVGQSEKEVCAALDVLDRKAASLPANSMLAAALPRGTFLLARTDKFQELKAQTQHEFSPALESAVAGAFHAGQDGNDVFMSLQLQESTPDAAARSRAGLVALKALANVNEIRNASAPVAATAAGGPTTRPISPVLDMLRDAEVEGEGPAVYIKLKINVQTLLDLLDQTLDEPRPEPKPELKPPVTP